MQILQNTIRQSQWRENAGKSPLKMQDLSTRDGNFDAKTNKLTRYLYSSVLLLLLVVLIPLKSEGVSVEENVMY